MNDGHPSVARRMNRGELNLEEQNNGKEAAEMKAVRSNSRTQRNPRYLAQRCAAIALSILVTMFAAPESAFGYAFGYVVADVRQPASVSGATSCPQRTHFLVAPGSISRQWSTSLGTSPATILTSAQLPSAQLSEIESTIAQSFSTWTGVAGVTLNSAALAALSRTSLQNSCSSADGVNSICFNQSDPAFTTGVLAFTRVTVADTIGETVGNSTSTFVGEILDADILVRPGDSSAVFATPQALSANPQAYDLESVVIHELGHFFGLEHSGVWLAMMQPFVPSPGTFAGARPSLNAPDAPLADDDRTGLRVLYPDPNDLVHVGSIRGHVLPANPLSLSTRGGATGIFAAQVVAIDASTGNVIAAARGGWSCSDPGPAIFDGWYSIDRLAVGPSQAYQIYAEPFTGIENDADVAKSFAKLCRNSSTDPNWPVSAACSVPAISTNFTARIR